MHAVFDSLPDIDLGKAAKDVGKAAAGELKDKVGGLGEGLAGAVAGKLLDVVDAIASDAYGIDFPNGEQMISFANLAASGWANFLANAAKDMTRKDGYAGGETLRDVLGPWAMQAKWPGASQVALARGWFWAVNAVKGGSIGENGMIFWGKKLNALQNGKSVEYYWPPAAKGAQKYIAYPGEVGGAPVKAEKQGPALDPLLSGFMGFYQADQAKKAESFQPYVQLVDTPEKAKTLSQITGVQTESDKTMMLLGAIALGVAIAKG